jgi:hypothetical protein
MKITQSTRLLLLAGLFTIGLQYTARAHYHPGLQRWINRDPINENGGVNVYAFLLNSPHSFFDACGLRGTVKDIGKWLAGDGRLCLDKSCDPKRCNPEARRLPERGWEDDVRRGKDPWRDIPEPGKCLDADAVATPTGVLQIHNGTTCTIRCNPDGSPKDVYCKKRVRFSPDPSIPPDPGLPPSPFQ